MTAYPPSMRHVLLGDRHQLLLDDLLIAERHGLVRKIGIAEKYESNPVLVPTEPHERVGIMLFGTLVFDEGKYRCWYHTEGDGSHFCYAESDNGVNWEKPSLGLVEWHGSRENNILFSDNEGEIRLAAVSVSKSQTEADPQRRYRGKLFMYRRGNHRGPERGLYMIHSSDGIHWSAPEATPSVACNECGGFLWDESRSDLVDLNKTGHALEMFNREDMRVGHVRCSAVATSDNGVVWSPYRVVLTPNLFLDEPYDEFYHLHGYRWGGSYVGYLRIYHNTPETGSQPKQGIDIQLVTSRDGETWERVCPGDEFISAGKPQNWDFGRVAIGNGPPAVVGDRMRIFYCGQPTDHRGGDGLGGRGENGLDKGYTAKVGFVTIRKDGFVSLNADNHGELVTHPVSVGSRLSLNVDASAGDCLVELQSPDGKPIPGYSLADCRAISTDEVDGPVVWEGGSEIDVGRICRVRLSIVVKKAALYSWTFME